MHTTRPLAAQRFRAHSTSESEVTGPLPPTPPGPHSSHIWKESFFPCVLCIPVALFWSYLLYYEHMNRWDRRFRSKHT